jgi:hypothetical protein
MSPAPKRVVDLPPVSRRAVIAEHRDSFGRRSVLFSIEQGRGALVYYLHRIDDVQAELLGTDEAIAWCVDHGKPIPKKLRRFAHRADLQRRLIPPAPAEFVPVPADIAILTVLREAEGAGLQIMQIVQKANGLNREVRTAGKGRCLEPLSETTVKGRIPLLEEARLVARPRHKDGRPTRKKGVGITALGRRLLKTASR